MNKKIVFFVFFVLFKLSLDASYFLILSKHFQSVYVFDTKILRYLVSWLLYFLTYPVIKSEIRKVSNYFFLTLVFGVLGPMCVVFGMDENRGEAALFVSLLSCYFIFFLVAIKSKLRVLKPTYIKNGYKVGAAICIFFVMYLIVWYKISGVNFNLDFRKVYEFREMNNSLSSFGVLAYLNFWVYKIFAGSLLVFCLHKKKYLGAIFVTLVFVYFYAANNHKSVLLSPLIILSVWYYFRNSRSATIIPAGFSFLILFSILSNYLFSDIWASALIPHRVFLTPAHLAFQYFDFFESNDFILFSNSFLKRFIDYPYPTDLSHLIGDFDGTGYAANNGYVSSGYAQCGVWGVLVYSFIIAILLRFFDSLTKSNIYPVWFVIAITLIPIRDFTISMDLLTTILTGGICVLIPLLYLARERPLLLNNLQNDR